MKQNCDGCGKETNFFALSMSCRVDKDMKEEDRLEAEESRKISFGVYNPNVTYNFCYECILKSLGVKP